MRSRCLAIAAEQPVQSAPNGRAKGLDLSDHSQCSRRMKMSGQLRTTQLPPDRESRCLPNRSYRRQNCRRCFAGPGVLAKAPRSHNPVWMVQPFRGLNHQTLPSFTERGLVDLKLPFVVVYVLQDDYARMKLQNRVVRTRPRKAQAVVDQQ